MIKLKSSLIFLILIFTIINFSSCKKNENVKINSAISRAKETQIKDISKIEKLNDDFYILSPKELHRFKENDTIAENIVFPDSLVPLDIKAFDDKLYILGLIKYKVKIISGNGNLWKEIPLPDFINGGFIDVLLERFKKNAQNDVAVLKYYMYRPAEEDNYKKFRNYYNLLKDNIYLIADKSVNVITKDTLYFYSDGKWMPKYLPEYIYRFRDGYGVIMGDTIGENPNTIGYSAEDRVPLGMGKCRILKDSILYFGLNYIPYKGYIINLDFRKDNKTWNLVMKDVYVSQIIPDTAKNSFYYSTYFEAPHGGFYIEGILGYYDTSFKKNLSITKKRDRYLEECTNFGKIVIRAAGNGVQIEKYSPVKDENYKNIIYNFASDEYIKKYRPEKLFPNRIHIAENSGNRTVIQDMQKINNKFFILTKQGIFVYENNNIKKIIDDDKEPFCHYLEGFYKFFVDNSENIYVASQRDIAKDFGNEWIYEFFKFTKTNSGYSKSKITFYN